MLRAISELNGISCKILFNHKSDLEDDSVVELAQVETGELLDLVKTIYQSVTVYEQLSGGLGYIQVVLKELLDGEECLVVEGLDAALLEYFFEEGVAESCGEMIDKSCDTEVIVAYDVLVRIEYLADLKCGLSLLEGASQILNAYNGSTDTYIYLSEELCGKRVRNGACQLFEVLNVDIVLNFLYKHNVVFGDIEYEILVLIGEQILDNIVSRNIVGAYNADKENHSADVCVEMQLSSL